MNAETTWKRASRPPNDNRTVEVRLKNGGNHLGYFERNRWQLVTGAPANVEAWQERPGYVRQATKRSNNKTGRNS